MVSTPGLQCLVYSYDDPTLALHLGLFCPADGGCIYVVDNSSRTLVVVFVVDERGVPQPRQRAFHWRVDGGQRACRSRANRRPDWGMVGGGVLGSLGGILLVEYLRRSLLKGEIGWKLLGLEPPTNPQPHYFFLQEPDSFVLQRNFNDIFGWMMHHRSDLPFVIVLPLVLALALAVILVVRHGIKAAPLAIYAVTQVTALLLFARIGETRTLLQLVPFLCIGGMLAAKPDWDTTASAQRTSSSKAQFLSG